MSRWLRSAALILFGVLFGPATRADVVNVSPPFLAPVYPLSKPATTPAIDGTPTVVSNTGSNSIPVAVTTTAAGDVIIILFTGDGTSVTGVTDVAGLTWHSGGAYTAGGTQPDIEQWWAYSPGVLTADTVTVALSNGISSSVAGFGVSGVNTGTPLDSNTSLLSGAGQTACTTTSSATYSTSHAVDMVFVIKNGNTGNPGTPTGFTSIVNAGYASMSYQNVSTIQTGTTVATISANDSCVSAIVGTP